MDTYAYEQGYERGFAGRPVRPFPEQCGPKQIVWLKAGWADGDWDRRQGVEKNTSNEVQNRRTT
jgi:ribosome modulation factor